MSSLPVAASRGQRIYRCSTLLLRLSLFNLLIVALIGVLLRATPFLDALPFSYHNLLHGHSHFAFGGWVQPVLLALLLRHFPELAQRVAFRHWRNVIVLLLASAWGMLLTFPVQGYAAGSITFATLSIGAGIYAALLVWRSLKGLPATASRRFLGAAFAWMTLSALGPFATGPLAAGGGTGCPLYQDAIYWYLHFQYNGGFTFLVLALLYRQLERAGTAQSGKKVFACFHVAVLPAYALSVLWQQSPPYFYWIGGAAACLQLIGYLFLCRDLRWCRPVLANALLLLSIAAFGLKLVLQALGALPALALLAYQQRPFVIAYLHLVLLGFVSLYVFARIAHGNTMRQGALLFVLAFVVTELLLILPPLGLQLPQQALWLLVASCFLPVGVALLLAGAFRSKEQPPIWMPKMNRAATNSMQKAL
jgi:hypothetical protein